LLRKTASGIILFILLVSTLTLAFDVRPAEEQGSTGATNGGVTGSHSGDSTGAISDILGSDEILYGSVPSPIDLITLDTVTGAGSLVGPSGTESGVWGLEYDPHSDTLYGVTNDAVDVWGNGQLLRIDRTTGLATPIGGLVGSRVEGLAYDSVNDELYGSTYPGNNLVVINTSTGKGTVIGSIGSLNLEGLAFDPLNGKLYSVDIGSGALISIEPSTGIGTAVAQISSSWAQLRGLSFDRSGNLYGVSVLFNASSSRLVTIDISTGQITDIGPTGYLDVEGLAFVAQSVYAPYPQIVEPSILNPEAPRHNDTLVIWGDSINVSAIELRYAEDIENTTFEYSPNGIDWNIIGTSYLGIKEWENWTDIDGDPFNSFRTWTVAWNTSGVGEGLYYIRATMVDTAGRVGQDNITVYFDPTPPIPEFTLPWGATVNGTVQISVVTNATDILYTQFESLKVSTDYPVKPVMEPKTKCAWNAMAALLMYWASLPSKTYPQDKPHGNLIQDDANPPKDMSADALIDAMIDYYNTLHNLTGTPNAYDRNKGLKPDQEEEILDAWLKKKGFKGDISHFYAGKPGSNRLTLQKVKKEFEGRWGGPMILGIEKDPFFHTNGHAMILKSFENKPDENGDYTVDFADSAATATKGVRETKMGAISGNDLYIEMKFGQNGQRDERDGWWFVEDKIQIVPDDWEDLNLEQNPPYQDWIPQDIDYNGTKRWYCALDTTQLEEEYYFIRATMVDSSGNNGTETTEVLVDNIPPIPGDHDLAIENLTVSETSINVTVKNSGRYNETAYVCIYSRYVWSMTSVDLVSGAKEMLTFEWAPSPGLYNITAEANAVLDELNTADNIFSKIYVTGPIGDINHDCTVDILDAILLANVYGKEEGQEGWNPDANINMTPDQVTGMQVIDILDALVLAYHFNQHCA
jgi:hypothetical protein